MTVSRSIGYVWRLDCGHTLKLGVSVLDRPPRNRAWCPTCRAYKDAK